MEDSKNAFFSKREPERVWKNDFGRDCQLRSYTGLANAGKRSALLAEWEREHKKKREDSPPRTYLDKLRDEWVTWEELDRRYETPTRFEYITNIGYRSDKRGKHAMCINCGRHKYDQHDEHPTLESVDFDNGGIAARRVCRDAMMELGYNDYQVLACKHTLMVVLTMSEKETQ
jgi:hypothetical protein